MKKHLLFSALVVAAFSFQAKADVATFEDLTLAPETTWSGDEEGDDWYYGLGYTQYFVSGDFSFKNCCIPDYKTWVGFAYTNSTATVYSALDDQFNSCVGHGYDGSSNFCVAYPDGTMWGEDFDIKVNGAPCVVPGFYITNTAWVVKAILDTDGYNNGFNCGDYFKINIFAHDAAGNVTASRDFYLADFRASDEADRYYVKDWEYVDLSKLGEAASFTFTFEGTQENSYGLSTPTYFCIDNFGDTGTETVHGGSSEQPTTGISDIEASDNQTSIIFNIQGIRVDDMSAPGLYIVNGRKVLKR